ncbi:hypothetical protein [Labedaea rhizosphaerae]|uniref:Uncharacterized protein n=1 Tax=Labedaea rhizosphaerae TaxID=598644 RepID=A0A4R6RZR0_LABRH|nr:hypothetical protein [Labedaea rhizosphaerae]TDP91815.1 hypothetical protein EV186_10824 [Labedaea rhizosphaerae]
MADIEDFGWVADEHREVLGNSQTSAWEDQWPEFFGRYLDHRWPGWAQASDEERTEWLRPRIEALALGWVTAEQRAWLGQLTGDRGDWRDWLPVQLDEWWPEWDQSTPAELAGWLNSYLPSLLPPATEDPSALGWVTESQQAQLEALQATHGDWREWLPAQLTAWWPQWTEATTDRLVPWLDEALPGLAVPVDGGADPRDLAWVTEAQRAQLEAHRPTRGDWREWLPEQLNQWWPEWTASTPDQLTPWLDEAMVALGPAPVADTAADTVADTGTTAVDVAESVNPLDEIEVSPEEIPAEDKPAALSDPDNVFSLAWVTESQGSQLDEMTEIRGDWHDWLIDEMTERRPEWVDLSPDELTAWLDDLIPLLVLPTDADALIGSLNDAFENNPEMSELAAEFTEEELAEIIEQALLSRAE